MPNNVYFLYGDMTKKVEDVAELLVQIFLRYMDDEGQLDHEAYLYLIEAFEIVPFEHRAPVFYALLRKLDEHNIDYDKDVFDFGTDDEDGELN